MEQLLLYIKNIGFFLILMSIVCNVLPDNGYKKYCRLFCGMVLVLLVINPFSEFLNYDGDIKDIFINNTYKSQLMEIKNQLREQEQSIDSMVTSEYEDALCRHLSGYASEAGLYLVDVLVELENLDNGGDIYISSLTLFVTDDKSVYDKYADESTDNIADIEIKKIVIGEERETDNNMNPRALQLMHSVAEFLNLEENRVIIEIV